MREIEFLSPESPIVVDELRPFNEHGEVGERAYDYLQGRVDRRELVARSFTLYKDVLYQFAVKSRRPAGVRSSKVVYFTPTEAFHSEHVAEFLAEAKSPFDQRLRRQVLRHFASFCGEDRPESLVLPLERVLFHGKPVLLRPAAATSASVAADVSEHVDVALTIPPVVSTRIPTAVEVAALEAEVGHILSMTAGQRGVHTADDYSVMRAAAVAFCRFGGAVVADLVGMKLADVLTADQGDAPESTGNAVGTFWRARRPRRQPGLSGLAKFAEVEIEYEQRARAPIAAWIATRLMDGATSGDAVFIRPSTRTPLNRRLLWRLVAGLPLKETKRKNDPVTASRAERAPTKDRESPPLLSPSRLRHVQGIKLVEQYQSGDPLTAALRRHMGVSGRGIAWIYARDGAARGFAAQACGDAAAATDISEIAPSPQ